jgi:acetylornithine deacetylase
MGPVPLTETQRRVLAAIDDDAIVRLASDLVRIPSFTTEETVCAEWLANYLAEQGLEVDLQEVEPGRKQTVARLRGSGGGRSIMLNGHIDTIRWPAAGRATRSSRGSPTASCTATASST